MIIIFAGIFIYQNAQQSQQQLLINEPSPTLTSTPTPTPQVNNNQTKNQVAVFETFKDNYGFQMQYPSDKTVMNVPTSKMVACNNSCPAELTVNGIESAYTNQTINGVKYCIYSGSKTTAGISYNDYLFLTIKNKNCYGLEISYQNSTNEALVFQSLSTIKFLK